MLNLLYQYNNIYKKKSTNKRLKKNVATVPLGTITTVQNFGKKKDKVANQNGTVDKQWKTLYEQCKNIVEKRAQIDDWEKKKKKRWWTNQKYYSFYIFTQQVSQHFHKTFIFSCSWSQFHILLFYFGL